MSTYLIRIVFLVEYFSSILLISRYKLLYLWICWALRTRDLYKPAMSASYYASFFEVLKLSFMLCPYCTPTGEVRTITSPIPHMYMVVYM